MQLSGRFFVRSGFFCGQVRSGRTRREGIAGIHLRQNQSSGRITGLRGTEDRESAFRIRTRRRQTCVIRLAATSCRILWPSDPVDSLGLWACLRHQFRQHRFSSNSRGDRAFAERRAGWRSKLVRYLRPSRQARDCRKDQVRFVLPLCAVKGSPADRVPRFWAGYRVDI